MNRTWWASLWVGAVLCAGARGGDTVLPRLLEGDVDNGLHVVVCPRSADGRVEIRLTVGAGRFDDQDGDASCELLARTMAATWRADGPQRPVLRCDVSDRETALCVTTPANDLPAIFDGLAQLLTRVDFADPIVAEQKAGLLRDLAASARSPEGEAASVWADVAVPGHPGRFSGAQRVRAATGVDEARALALRSARFVPGNAVLVVAGDAEPGSVIRMARASFQSWPRGGLPEAATSSRPLPTASARLIGQEARAAAWCELVVGWRLAIPTPDEVATHDVLTSLLAEGPEARVPALFPRSRVLDRSRDVAFATPGGLAWTVSVAGPARDEAIESLARVGVELGRGGPTPVELDRARNRVRMRWSVVVDRLDLLAARLASDRLWRGDARALDADVRRLDELTVADVRDAAARWLRPEAVVVTARPTAAPTERTR